jgi:hypothetical protein
MNNKIKKEVTWRDKVNKGYKGEIGASSLS